MHPLEFVASLVAVACLALSLVLLPELLLARARHRPVRGLPALVRQEPLQVALRLALTLWLACKTW